MASKKGEYQLHEILKKVFGFDSFKGNQEAIIQNVLEGKDTFVIMPTGDYQVSLYTEGLTSVTPGLCPTFCTKNIPGPSNDNSGNNWSYASVPSADPYMETVDTSLNDNARKEAAKKADDILADYNVALPLERWGPALNRIASGLKRFGSERGGMLVSLTGTRDDGTRALIEWQLIADANHGPEIPCMAAILLAEKLCRDDITTRGAFPCMGFLTLTDFESEFKRWQITTVVRERAA